MGRLIIAANRLPIKIERQQKSFNYKPSEGGLATGLNSLKTTDNKIWVGWPGQAVDDEQEQEEITAQLEEKEMYPLFLTEQEVTLFYEGFSNKTIWPLFHYFTEYVRYKKEFWQAYYDVNRQYADKVLDLAKAGDTIWVHDYQLLLVPGMIKEALPQSSIGFFLHIPFPSSEVFRLLPWRAELLEGILGADLIGFHTTDYMRHFMSTVYRILGHEPHLGQLLIEDRPVQVDLFPMGINYEKFSSAIKEPECLKEANAYKEKFDTQKLILSVDRLDYSKGIINRLKAFQQLLASHPELEGEISLILIVVPSRAGVEKYQELKKESNEMVGFINGRYSGLDWTPIHYMYRSLPFNSLVSLYNICKIGLVTPIRDGMNLIAKEFVASKADKSGVLILSEMAGAANELTDALLINPNDIENIRNALEKALHMPRQDQRKRMDRMQQQLKTNTVDRWAANFLEGIKKAKNEQYALQKKLMNNNQKENFLMQYKESEQRLIILDYDGTLGIFDYDSQAARPDNKLYILLKQLTADPSNEVVMMSGRDKQFLHRWFGKLSLHLVAEHGAWFKESEQEWESLRPLTKDWKEVIRPTLEKFTEQTPRSFIEEKEYSLVWHYEDTDAWIADIRRKDLYKNLRPKLSKYTLDILEGDKALEIKNKGVDKGKAVQHWLKQEYWDFWVAMGDDRTDEAVFRVMPEEAYTFKIGLNGETEAHYYLRSVEEVKELLTALGRPLEETSSA